MSGSFENRTPVVGDRFIGVFKYGTQSFIATCRVDSDGHAVLSLVVETTGAEGQVSANTVSAGYYTMSGSTGTVSLYTDSSVSNFGGFRIDDGEL